jgi:hypothetical protein
MGGLDFWRSRQLVFRRRSDMRIYLFKMSKMACLLARSLSFSSSFLVFVLILVPFDATAESIETPALKMELPAGFKEGGLEIGKPREPNTRAFTKLDPKTAVNTVLELSAYDFGARMPNVPKEQLGEMADRYAAQFLEATKQRRQAFSAAPPVRVLLDGNPASKISWTGSVGGRSGSGMLYCTVVGTRVIRLQVQHLQVSPSEAFRQAEESIKAVRLKR